MKIGSAIKGARERRGLSIEEMSSNLKLTLGEYENIEAGQSELEAWGSVLARLAIKLKTPTSRLISETGKSRQAVEGACGTLIRRQREARSLTLEQMAKLSELPEEELNKIETGESPIEKLGPLLLQCAELVDQPVFNLLYKV